MAMHVQLRRVRLAAEGGVEQANAWVPAVGDTHERHAPNALQRALKVLTAQCKVTLRTTRIAVEVVPGKRLVGVRVLRARLSGLWVMDIRSKHQSRLAAADARAQRVVQHADLAREPLALCDLIPGST